MIALWKLPLVLLCGLAASTSVLAQIVTIGPDTHGVKEFNFMLEPTSNPNFLAPHFTRLPLGPQINPFGVDLLLFDPASGCLRGCRPDEPGSSSFFDLLDVSFNKPVSFVDVLKLQADETNTGIWAYNKAGQLVGVCYGTAGFILPPGCYRTIGNAGNALLTNSLISNGTADISTLLIGGYGDIDAGVPAVRFSVTPVNTPEPGTFVLLALALAGLAVTRKRGFTAAS